MRSHFLGVQFCTDSRMILRFLEILGVNFNNLKIKTLISIFLAHFFVLGIKEPKTIFFLRR